MTPKEKAKELFEKMWIYALPNANGRWEYAKQCALIAVREIMGALSEYDNRTEQHLKNDYPNYISAELQNMEEDFKYWSYVLKEIEKL